MSTIKHNTKQHNTTKTTITAAAAATTAEKQDTNIHTHILKQPLPQNEKYIHIEY